MKIIICYILGFSLSWLGLCSIMVGLAYRGQPGAGLPLLAGGLAVLIGMRFLLALIRRYFPPRRHR
ncbi:hypothetical protein LJB86_00120 [Deltaproteobacteria bacterium OttesenSCG-928-M10]|nr:hypothetical protein [Deltaproteobacteria bacterium OttesenSCG-928-M10]